MDKIHLIRWGHQSAALLCWKKNKHLFPMIERNIAQSDLVDEADGLAMEAHLINESAVTTTINIKFYNETNSCY